MSGNNWLSTLGSWLATPFKSIFGPWWEKKIDGKAESLSVKRKLVDAIVQFRVRDFCRDRSLDTDKEIGISHQISIRLGPRIEDRIDVTGAKFLSEVEQAIHLYGATKSAWVQLACLAEKNKFNPRHIITVEFTDEKGQRTHGSTMVAALQDEFPFWKLFNHQEASSSVSTEALDGLEWFVSTNFLPDIKFEITEQMPPFGQLSGENTEVLSITRIKHGTQD